MGQSVRVLVVDDSAVMRKLISDILDGNPDIAVVGTARNGMDALDKVRNLNPDVVTMDIEMPKMDGLTALQHIMSEEPVPVIMVSAMDKRQADITMKALDLGAVDFISKTSGTLSLDIERRRKELVSKVNMAARIRVTKRRNVGLQPKTYTAFQPGNDEWLIAIGASTGGPKAIPEVLSRLPRNIPAAILLVQHMPKGFTESFAQRLNWYTSLEVREAREGDEISIGTVLVAPGNQHMELDGRRIHLSGKSPVNSVGRSVDVLMKSSAESFGANCIGVLLSGMGSDGAKGMMEIKKHGGRTIVQDEGTCVVYGMPKAAVDLRIVDEIVPIHQIAENLIHTMKE